MRLEAVTLDAAGTIVTVAEPVGVTYARLALPFGFTLAPEAIEHRFHAALAAAPPLAFPGATPETVVALERAWWRAIVARALGADPQTPAVDGAFAALFAHYARPDAWRVFPEVPEVLAALRARGLGLAIVSNFDGRLPALVAALGLAASVDVVVHSTATGCAKPHPAIFAAALSRLDVAAAAAVHVGDDIDADVLGALGAGLRAMLVERAGRSVTLPTGVRVLRSLAELPRAIDGT